MLHRCLALACLALLLGACRQDPSDPADTPGSQAAVAEVPGTSAGTPDPAGNAQDQVEASMDKFLAARSFHATMDMQGAQSMTNEMDFVAPDRYRMTMPVGTQVIIGDTMYMQMQGERVEVPLPEGALGKWRDPLQIQQSQAGLSVEAQGRDTIDGQSARKYLVRHTEPVPSEFTYWIGNDDLPLQLRHRGEAQGTAYTMTIRYSRFNDPTIRIDAPQ